jgi:predicted nucleic acid-binding protein
MIIVDTSVWVGTLIERDAHYAESSAWLDFCILRNVNLHFPLLIFPELAGVLARSGMSPVDTAGEISKIANRSMIGCIRWISQAVCSLPGSLQHPE